MVFTRQRSSKRLLEIDWQHPAALQLEEQKGPTVSTQRMVALPRADALKWLAKDDPRPLLVLRECTSCKGTDDALLTRKVNNEKTQLLTRWFRCVKLPTNVMDQNHTFHNLFAGKHPPHLFLATHNGDTIIPLDGQQGQSKLWADMKRVLRSAYERDPEKAIAKIFRLMSKLDTVDEKLSTYREQLEVAIEKHGPKSGKVRKARMRVAQCERERDALLEKQKKVADLGLKKPEPSKAGPEAGSEAGAPAGAGAGAKAGAPLFD